MPQTLIRVMLNKGGRSLGGDEAAGAMTLTERACRRVAFRVLSRLREEGSWS